MTREQAINLLDEAQEALVLAGEREDWEQCGTIEADCARLKELAAWGRVTYVYGGVAGSALYNSLEECRRWARLFVRRGYTDVKINAKLGESS